MKRKLLVAILTIAIFSTGVLAQNVEYENAILSSSSLAQDIHCSAVDAAGNIYLAGRSPGYSGFGAEFTFNGTTITLNNGNNFIIKTNSSGVVQWYKSIGGTNNPLSKITSICADNNGNLYIAGQHNGNGTYNFNFDGTIITSLSGSNDGFLAKCNSSGTLQWLSNFQGTNTESISKITCDNAGNVYAALSFTSSVLNIQGIIYNNNMANGSEDNLVLKINSTTAAVIWGRQLVSNGTGYVSTMSMSVDNNQNIYLCGNFSGSVNFGGVSLSSTPVGNIFITKISDTGTAQWAAHGKSNQFALVSDITITASSSSVVVTGGFKGNLFFEGTSASSIDTIYNSSLDYDAYVVKLTSAGQVLNIASVAGSGLEVGAVLTCDVLDNIWLGGSFNGSTLTLGNNTLNNAGGQDIFIAKMDPLLNITESDAIIGDGLFDGIADIHILYDGNVVITGSGNGNFLNIGANSFNLDIPFANHFFIAISNTTTFSLWTGNTSSNWFSASNWEPQQIPTDTNNVVIQAGRPNYPVITSGTAKCKRLNIQSGAQLSMAAGTMNVYGFFDYHNSSCLNLTGGTVKLYGGQQVGIKSGTQFYNLTLTSFNNDPSENDYAIEGSVTIAGNLVMSGTTAGNNPEYPSLFMLNSSKLFLKGNITVNQGHLGTTNDLLPLADNNLLPEVVLSGNAASTQQQLRFKNKVPAFSNRSGIIANMVVLYNNVKLFNTGNSVQVLNLEVAEDFNLYGNVFITGGKIIYNPNFGGKIKNTGSYNTGKLWIQNDVRYSTDLQKAELRCDKYGSYLGFVEDVGGTKANDTLVLLSDLTTDIIEWNGYIDMYGKNVTLGATTRSTGYLAGGELGSSIATGTLKLIGNSSCPQYNLFAKRLNNLTINSPDGAQLTNYANDQSDLEVYGIIRHTLGNFDRNGTTVKLAAHPLANGVNVAKLIEGDTSTCYDSEQGRIYIDTTYTTPLSNVNTGGLGFFITTPETWLNKISIHRYNASNLDDIIGSNMVGRIFLISNKNAGGNLNARLKIKYAEGELNGIPESELRLYRYNSNLTDPYQLIPSTVNTTSNIVSATSNLPEIDLYDASQPGTYYFLASPNTPPARMTAPVAAMAKNNPLHINAYPNPFSNSVTIALNSSTAENAQLFVTDITGRIYYNSSQVITEGENKIELTCLQNAPTGIYFVTVKTMAGNNTIRVIKKN